MPARGETLAGPVPASVERVIDGDTLRVRAHIWLGQQVEADIRLRGVDTPELRAGCESERIRAEAARDFLIGLVEGQELLLTGISGGKYFGRIVADAATGDGRDIAAALLDAGHGRAYQGGSRAGWCDLAVR